MLDLFLKGGPLMYPLLAFSITSIAIIIERGIVIGRAGIAKHKLANVIEVLANDGLYAAIEQYKDLRGSVASMGLKTLTMVEKQKPEIENIVTREGVREIRSLAKHLHLLELIGKISPMVGLSGTVLGLTGTFQTVAGLNTMANPATLAGGIWEALITTVTGLFVAIPAILCFHLYENRIKSISFEMKNHIESVISMLKETKRI
jgi:biopolymer transport protein ExbB